MHQSWFQVPLQRVKWWVSSRRGSFLNAQGALFVVPGAVERNCWSVVIQPHRASGSTSLGNLWWSLRLARVVEDTKCGEAKPERWAQVPHSPDVVPLSPTEKWQTVCSRAFCSPGSCSLLPIAGSRTWSPPRVHRAIHRSHLHVPVHRLHREIFSDAQDPPLKHKTDCAQGCLLKILIPVTSSS